MRIFRNASLALACLASAGVASAQHMERVGGIGGDVDSVLVSGTTAYIGEGGELIVLDVSDPARPVRTGTLRLADGSEQGRTVHLRDMALSGTTLYVAGAADGLSIVDVSDPSAPRLLAAHETPGFADGIALSGTTVYVADDSGLRVVDAGDPSAPSEIGSFSTPDATEGVAVVGTTAYIASSALGILVLDVSNPAAIAELGRFDTGEALGVTVAGGLAYVADGAGGLRIVDVSNPAAPALAGFLDVPGLSVDVFLSGTVAYLATLDQGVEAIDVSDPAAPILLGQFEGPGEAVRVVAEGALAYVADRDSGLRIASFADPSVPMEIGAYDTPDDASAVAIAGTTAYVADGAAGLAILDVADPSLPVWRGTVDIPGRGVSLPGRISDVAVAGSFAYTADDSDGIHVVDLSDPDAPAVVGELATPDRALGIAAGASRVFVAGGDAGLHIVDATDPTSPTLVATLDTPGLAFSVTLSPDETIAYVANVVGGFFVVDVSDPSAPVLLHVNGGDGTGATRDIAVVGTTLYVVDEREGLTILDASDPSAPVRLGGYNTPFLAIAVAVERGIAYVNDAATLLALDVSNPGTPVLLGEIPIGVPGGPIGGIALAGGLAYVAAPNAGITIARYAPPPLSNISTRGFVGTEDGAMIGGIIVSGTEARRIAIAGIGPDLANYGVPGFLANPSLALFTGETMLATNDDWMDSANAAEILASGHAPNDALEPAIVASLEPGEYTAILTGVGATPGESTGIGLVQAFDLGPAEGGTERGSRLANISTRVATGTDERQAIAGFIVEGGPKRIVVRALGPTLGRPPFDVAGAMENPELAILSGQTVLRTNADWEEDLGAATIRELGLAPPDALEAAIAITLDPGAYTAIVSGAGGGEGVALVEIYAADFGDGIRGRLP